MKADNNKACSHIISTSRKIITDFILMVFTLSLMLSCSSAPPQQTYLEKNHLSKLKVVALHVSAAEIDVRYSREENMSAGAGAAYVTGCLLISPLLIIGAVAGDALVKSSKDSKHAEGVKEALGKTYFEKVLGNYFIEELAKANLFEKVNYSIHDDNYRSLVNEGYDSLIRLKIEELALKKGVYNLKLFIKVSANMIDLQEEEVIWDRFELVVNDEEYSLDDYKAEGGKILKDSIEKVLKKVTFRLASDIIYCK